MRALLFISKLLLKILVAPVILLLTVAIWICVGIVYISGLVLGLISSAGRGSPDYLLLAKRYYPVGDGVSYQSLWPADGGDLAAG